MTILCGVELYWYTNRKFKFMPKKSDLNHTIVSFDIFTYTSTSCFMMSFDVSRLGSITVYIVYITLYVVKKLNGLKHFLRKTVAKSHNKNSKCQKAIT